jgi:hypothetical protein
MGPRAGPDECGKSRRHQDSIPIPSIPYKFNSCILCGLTLRGFSEGFLGTIMKVWFKISVIYIKSERVLTNYPHETESLKSK